MKPLKHSQCLKHKALKSSYLIAALSLISYASFASQDIGIPDLQKTNDIGFPKVSSSPKKLKIINPSVPPQELLVDLPIYQPEKPKENKETKTKTSSSNDIIDLDSPLGASNTHVEEPTHNDTGKLIPLTKECVDKATSAYGVHPDVMYAILLVEGGTVGETNHGNVNGTKDLNLFQINESNLPELMKEFGITRDQVLNDGCLAAAIATRHLLKSVAGQPEPKTKMEYLRILARYHSATPEYNMAYALRLKNAFEFLSKHSE